MPSGCGRLQTLLIAAPATISSSCMLLSVFRVGEGIFHTYMGAGTATISYSDCRFPAVVETEMIHGSTCYVLIL